MAKQTVGKLNVMLTAKTGPFVKGMTKGRRSIGGFARSISAGTAKLVGFGSALAALAAGGGLGALVKNSLEAIDASTKLAARLGDTTQNIDRLAFAAGISGLSTAELAKSLEQLTRRVGEAKTGTGLALQTLDKLGMSADALSRKSPTEMFNDMAVAIAKLPTQADRANASYNLFGRAGIKLINLLSVGGRGIEKLGKEFDHLAGIVGARGAASVERANDALLRMRTAFAGVGRAISLQVAPMLAQFSAKLANALAARRADLALFIRSGITVLLNKMRDLRDFIEPLSGSLGQATNVMKVLSVAVKGLAAAFIFAKVAALGFNRSLVSTLPGSIAIITAAWARSRAESTRYGDEILRIGNLLGMFNDKAKQFEDAGKRIGDLSRAAAKARQDFASSLDPTDKLVAQERLVGVLGDQLAAMKSQKKLANESLRVQLQAAKRQAMIAGQTRWGAKRTGTPTAEMIKAQKKVDMLQRMIQQPGVGVAKIKAQLKDATELRDALDKKMRAKPAGGTPTGGPLAAGGDAADKGKGAFFNARQFVSSRFSLGGAARGTQKQQVSDLAALAQLQAINRSLRQPQMAVLS